MRHPLSTLLAIVLAALAATAAAADGDALTLVDFESTPLPIEAAERVALVAEHATHGAKAGRVALDQPFDLNLFVSANTLSGGHWGEYEQLALDVFVDGGAVAVGGFIRDPAGTGWWDRYNIASALKPGRNRLTFPLAALDRQSGKGRVDPAKIDFVAIHFAAADAGAAPTVWLDDLRLTRGGGAAAATALYSFDGADAGRYTVEDYPAEFAGRTTAATTAEHATDGASALRIASGSPAGGVVFAGFAADWSGADALAFDAWNAEDHPVPIQGWVRSADPAADWWHRANWERVLRPGANAVRIPVGELATPGGARIDLATIVGFNLAIDRATVTVDRLRLAAGGEQVAVAGMRRFDFGPARSAVMPGFQAVSHDDTFSAARGFGWQPGGQFGRDFDILEMLGRHRPPDDLCRDFCMPIRATFSVALPNGRYGAWLMLSPPGPGWAATFARRTVTANGQPVVDQRYDAAGFAAYEFRFQDSEDLPGDDLWTRYIDPLFAPTRFAVDVVDGRLDLDFDGHGQWWAAMVDGLVVWPMAVDADAQRAIDALQSARKEQYDALHVERLPRAPAAYPSSDAERARGWVRFVHAVDRDFAVNSAPTPAEVAAARVVVRAPAGEVDSGCVGLWATEPCGPVTVELGDLAGPAGARIPRAAVQARVVRYKSTSNGATYTPIPKYLDDIPAAGVDLRPGVLRSLWFTVAVPRDAAPGEYRGEIRIRRGDGRGDRVRLSVVVPAIALDPIAIPLGMFNCAPLADAAGMAGGDAWWDAVRAMCVDLRAHGMTSIDLQVPLPLEAVEDGVARIRFADMDRFMAIAREAGFTQELDGYAIDTGFTLKIRPGVDYDAEARAKGAADYAALVRAYFAAVREHAAAQHWLPICFAFDDEYMVHPDSTPEGLARHAQLLRDNAPGFHFVAYDSVLDGTPAEVDARLRAVAQIDTWGAGNHAARDVETVRAAKRRLWLYNTGMDRFSVGLYLFFAHQREGVDGFFQWTYNGLGTYGHYYLASHNEAHYGVVYPSTRGLRSTPIWERMRSGCLDQRWLITATRLVAEARAAGRAAREADALQATIDAALAPLRFGDVKVDPTAGEGKADNPLAPGALDALRGRLTAGMAALRTAGGGQ